MMMNMLRHPATMVWMILAGVTVFSWWIGTDHGATGAVVRPHVGITMSVIVLALVKVRLILFHFMEVRGAPWQLQRVCDAWIGVVGVLLVSLYWAGTPGA